MDLNLAEILLLDAVTTITALVGGCVVFWKIVKPHVTNDIKKSFDCVAHSGALERLDEAVDELDEKKRKDYATLQAIRGENKAMMKALFALLEHARTQNSTGLMKQTQDHLQEFIIDH